MPGQLAKGKPPPLAFTELTCQFAPETRYLPAGKATRYIGGKVALTLSDGAAEGVCLIKRKPGGAAWGKRKPKPQNFDKGFIQVRATPADYAGGANYELTAYKLDDGASVQAAIDFPPGAESLARHGTEQIKAFPIVRTDGAILLWIRADTGIRKAAIDALAQVKGKRRKWGMDTPMPGNSAYLLIDNNLALKGVAHGRAGRGKHIVTSNLEHTKCAQCCDFFPD